EEVRNPSSALAILGKLPRRLHDLARHRRALGWLEGQVLAIILLQARLVVEGINLRGAAVHEQEDDTPGARLVVAGLRSERVPDLGRACEEVGEGEIAEPDAGRLQELAATQGMLEHGWLSGFFLLLCVSRSSPRETQSRRHQGSRPNRNNITPR